MKIIKLLSLIALLILFSNFVSAYYGGYYGNNYGYPSYSFRFGYSRYYNPYNFDRGLDFFERTNLRYSFDNRAYMGERMYNQMSFGNYPSYVRPAPSFFNY